MPDSDPKDRISQARRKIVIEHLIDATRKAVRDSGLEADIDEILTYAGVSRSTFYRYFPRKKAGALLAVAERMIRESRESIASLSEIRDAKVRMVGAFDVSFRQFEEYGQFATLALAGRLPADCQRLIDLDSVYRFIGTIINDCKSQGHCREGINTRHAVHVLFALISPDHFMRRLEDGADYEQIKQETMATFFHAFAAETSPVAGGSGGARWRCPRA